MAPPPLMQAAILRSNASHAPVARAAAQALARRHARTRTRAHARAHARTAIEVRRLREKICRHGEAPCAVDECVVI